MNNDPLNDCADDELERRIAKLESEEWLGALKGLKPAAGVDLYAIGFEAGKQSVSASNQTTKPSVVSVWLHTRTAMFSSVVSVAATLLLLVTLPDGANRQKIEPAPAEVAAQLESTTVAVENAPKNTPESSFKSTVPALNDVLAGVPSSWRDRLKSVELKVSEKSNSQHVVDVEPSRLRYAFQRRQLIEGLRGTIQ